MEWSEGALRLSAFVGIFLIMALLEFALPKRELTEVKSKRWFTNLAIGGIDSALVRLMAVFVVPLAATAAAIYAQAQGWGLFNATNWPAWLEIVLAIVILDFAIYLQHVASHKVPLLWRLHQVHHADPDIDVTTAIRFHPIEIGASMLYKILVVFLLGPAALAVVLFEVILNGCAMFNHANLSLPRWLDAALRTVLVTPDMHRVHHSVQRREHDSNYGFNLSIWDRLFRTYTAQPEGGHQGMTIGLLAYRDGSPVKLLWALLLPFRPMGKAQAGAKIDATKVATTDAKAAPTTDEAKLPSRAKSKS